MFFETEGGNYHRFNNCVGVLGARSTVRDSNGVALDATLTKYGESRQSKVFTVNLVYANLVMGLYSC